MKMFISAFQQILLVFISIFSFSAVAQPKDTLVIIPLGKGSSPVSTELTTPVISLSAGMYHISLIDSKGTLTTLTAPEAYFMDAPSFGEKLSKIATGDIHSVVVYSDSTLNQYFVNDGITMFYPEKLKKVVEISSGPKMSVALTSKGILYCWGNGKLVKNLAIPIKTYGVKTASVGKEHVSFINVKNKVFVWGDHSMQQNTIPAFSATPSKIASGDYHSVVLDEKGKVYVWGNNVLGQTNLPVISEKVKDIFAKNFRSMAVTENDNVYIWGMNQPIELNVAEIGKVKACALGNNFAILLISSTSQKLAQLASTAKTAFKIPDLPSGDSLLSGLKAGIPDSLKNKFNLLPKENFLSEYLTQNFSTSLGDRNTLEIENINSTFQEENSGTSIGFEGSNNKIKIINDGTLVRRTNSQQRIIFKGSNKNAVFYNSGTHQIENNNSTVIIDLDNIGVESEYPAEYNDLSGSFSSESPVTIDFDNLPNSFINDFPIVEGDYYAGGEVVDKASNLSKIFEEAGFFPDEFEKAQAFLYCKKIALGIKTLEQSDPSCKSCKLALFDIYYYGLFGMAVNLEKANGYFQQYSRIR